MLRRVTTAATRDGDPRFLEQMERVLNEVRKLLGLDEPPRSEPDGIVVTHSAGIVKIPFTELPEEYAKRFQYDAKKAKEFAEQDARRQEALYSQAQQERQIANARDAQFSAKSAADGSKWLKSLIWPQRAGSPLMLVKLMNG